MGTYILEDRLGVSQHDLCTLSDSMNIFVLYYIPYIHSNNYQKGYNERNASKNQFLHLYFFNKDMSVANYLEKRCFKNIPKVSLFCILKSKLSP